MFIPANVSSCTRETISTPNRSVALAATHHAVLGGKISPISDRGVAQRVTASSSSSVVRTSNSLSRRKPKPAAVSLRRVPSPDLRQTLLRRAALLPESDRTFIRQLLADGRNCRELAAISQVSIPITGSASRAKVCLVTRQARNTARVLQRRFARLAARLLSPEFTYVFTTLSQMCPTRARICTRHFIHGEPTRTIARGMCLPYATVRRICEHTSAKAQAIAAMAPPKESNARS
jgi:hypothetical protein